ncbi:MAG: omega-amidase [Methanofollis sp.]|nr:omega-amidase [Methanofollis sp.]
MKVCCCGMAPSAPVEEGLKEAEKIVSTAAAEGADLVLFPEQFATGWNPARPRAEPSILPAICGIAAEYGIWVVGSCWEGAVRPRNLACAVGPDGRVETTYAKIHLFSPGGEDRSCTPGAEPAVFDAGGMRFALAICYDLRFPDLFVHYAGCGADCVLVPAAWPAERLAQWELLLRARALDAACYAAGANACGSSCIAGPDGAVLGKTDRGYLIRDLKKEEVQRMRTAIPVMRDRRPDLYAAWRTPGER